MHKDRFPRIVQGPEPAPESQRFVPSKDYLLTLDEAKTLLREQKADEALGAYERAIEQTSPDIEAQARVYYERALALWELGRAQAALEDLAAAYSRIIAGDDNLPNGFLTAKILRKQAVIAAQADAGEPRGEQSSSA